MSNAVLKARICKKEFHNYTFEQMRDHHIQKRREWHQSTRKMKTNLIIQDEMITYLEDLVRKLDKDEYCLYKERFKGL